MTADPPADSACHLLLLPDGRLLIRNLTPELTRLLAALQPQDPALALRADLTAPPSSPSISPPASPAS